MERTEGTSTQSGAGAGFAGFDPGWRIEERAAVISMLVEGVAAPIGKPVPAVIGRVAQAEVDRQFALRDQLVEKGSEREVFNRIAIADDRMPFGGDPGTFTNPPLDRGAEQLRLHLRGDAVAHIVVEREDGDGGSR